MNHSQTFSTETRPPRVFLAEDDRDFRSLVASTLRGDGYEVLELTTGAALLQELRHVHEDGAEPPDVIISDHRMPGVTGIAAMELARGWGWTVPMVLITGFGEPALLHWARSAGVNAVLSKPFDLDDLRTAVRWYTPDIAVIAWACACCGARIERPEDDDDSARFCRDCDHEALDPDDPWIDIGGDG